MLLSRGAREPRLLVFLAIACVACFVALVTLPLSYTAPATEEDGPVEWASALFWLGASVVAFCCVRRRGWRCELATLAFAIGCFVLFGEEISWGQRVFGIQTPQALRDANFQQEINLHNLNIFRPESVSWREAFQTGEFSWGLILNADKIFMLGYGLFFFAIPVLLYKGGGERLRALLAKLGYRAPSWTWIITAAATLAVSYAFIFLTESRARQDSIAETREMVFALFALFYALEALAVKLSEPRRSRESLQSGGDPAS